MMHGYIYLGNGVISMLMGENHVLESQEINEGDVMRVPAGAQVYLINKDDKEKLKIAMLINPISSIPGRFKVCIFHISLEHCFDQF